MKASHDHISEELLARYFEKTATLSEIAQIQNWLDQAPEHVLDLQAFRILWEASHRAGRKKTFDTDAAWKSVSEKMGQAPSERATPPIADEKVTPVGGTKKSLWPGTLVAAAVAMLACAFGWFQLREYKMKTATVLASVSTAENVKEVLLPDGTKVFLNYHSKLTYPGRFTGDVRAVTLTGEAFFEVQRDTIQPFIIQANGSEVKVLGTSFNVRAYDKTPVRVDVSTGKVQVRNEGREIYLTKNQSAEVLADTIRRMLPDVNLMGYRTGIFEFTATHLEDVVSTIRNGYHADVRLGSDQLSQCRLTIRFEKEPLDETLSVIAESLSLKLRKDGKVYWLEGEGCR